MEVERRPGWRQLKKKKEKEVDKKQREEKTSSCGHLFVLLDHRVGPTAASLYKVEVPKLVPHSHSSSSSSSSSSSPPSKKKQYCIPKEPKECLEPIMEFPYPAYAREMCCVELDSKLYFMGGHLRETRNRYSLCGESDFPLDVHVFDTKQTRKETTPAARMHAGKPFPYAFTANGCIFVYDNSMPFLTNKHTRPESSFFEVFDGKWIQLPDPPFESVISGHAIFQGELLFFSCQGDLGNYVLCFNLNDLKWLKYFIHGFSQGHMFYGEAQFLNDTLYGMAGESESVPAAYPGFTPRCVGHHTSKHWYDPDTEQWPFRAVNCNTELFDDMALIGRTLGGIHNHIVYNCLSANLVYLGNRRFCYIRTGPFPDGEHRQYDGMILDYFAPYPGTVTEFFYGGRLHYFDEELLHSSHLKIESSHPMISARLQSCVFVSNKTPRRKSLGAYAVRRRQAGSVF